MDSLAVMRVHAVWSFPTFQANAVHAGKGTSVLYAPGRNACKAKNKDRSVFRFLGFSWKQPAPPAFPGRFPSRRSSSCKHWPSIQVDTPKTTEGQRGNVPDKYGICIRSWDSGLPWTGWTDRATGPSSTIPGVQRLLDRSRKNSTSIKSLKMKWDFAFGICMLF